MRAVQLMLEDQMSLRKALVYSGCSRKMYYHEPSKRILNIEPAIVDAVGKIALERPSYGTRRMAAMLSRELHVPVNRKRVQRIFRALNWIEPALTKKEVIRAASSLVEPIAPCELWEADFTYETVSELDQRSVSVIIEREFRLDRCSAIPSSR